MRAAGRDVSEDAPARRLPQLVPADGLLVILVVTWSLNIVISRYLLVNGFEPLVYSALRYLCSSTILVAYVRARHGPMLKAGSGSMWGIGAAVLLFTVNQVAFVYALTWADASVVAFMFGAGPIVTGIMTWAVGAERISWRFAIAAVVSLAGVGLIALSAGAEGDTAAKGVVAAVVMLLTWCAYTVLAAWMMRTRSSLQITAQAFLGSAAVIGLLAIPHLGEQDWSLPLELWLLLGFTIGSLIVTNMLYLRSTRHLGAAHTALFANLQPFVAVLLAVLLLSEALTPLDLIGGALIAVGITLVWKVHTRRSVPTAIEHAARSGPPG